MTKCNIYVLGNFAKKKYVYFCTDTFDTNYFYKLVNDAQTLIN